MKRAAEVCLAILLGAAVNIGFAVEQLPDRQCEGPRSLIDDSAKAHFLGEGGGDAGREE